MTEEQVIALVIICTFLIGLFAYAYRIGMRHGMLRGSAQTHAKLEQTVRELEASLTLIRADHRHLAQHCKTLRQNSALKDEHYQVLLDIAEKLRIAAETFSAFKTGKKLERDARSLHQKALEMAASIKPLEQEQAA